MFLVLSLGAARSLLQATCLHVTGRLDVAQNQYPTFLMAVQTSSPGDSILVEVGVSTNVPVTISHSLQIFGVGYERHRNFPYAYTGAYESTIGELTIACASCDVYISGVSLPYGLTITGGQSVIVESCKVSSIFVYGLENLAIVKSLIYSWRAIYSNWSSACGCTISQHASLLVHNTSTVSCSNNILSAQGPSGAGASFKTISLIPQSSQTWATPMPRTAPGSGLYSHNYFARDVEFTANTIASNNIFGGTQGYAIANGTSSHNVGRAGCSSNCAPGYVQVPALDSIFVLRQNLPAVSSDNIFQLRPNSVAAGAGIGGVDPGPFGGSDPYRLSGLPPIPYVEPYALDLEVSNQVPLPVHIKAGN